MNRSHHVAAAVAGLIILSVLVIGLFKAYQQPPLILQGQIEATERSVSSKLTGRIDSLAVRRGDRVEIGSLLFSIHSAVVEAKRRQALGGFDAASAQQRQAETGARVQEISAAKDQWLKAQAANKLRKSTYQRVENLYQEGVVSEQKRDEARTQWQAAQYTEQAALAMYQIAQEGARDETKAAALGQQEMAQGALDEVDAYLADSQMTAPISGEVTEVLLQPGELAPAGFPVVSMVDMNDSWAVFQLREDLLSRVKQGDRVNLRIPALDAEFPYRVAHISALGDFATWRATESGHDFDMRTFEVELRPIKPIADLKVGMSVLLDLEQNDL
ncbi:HlyD family secretion protein [Sinobacterium caligoides]|uniref:HlyD family secretion protein n=1 Tax=Sinobacterium caligoides TaxID=933926 RepID=A0A3N2DZU2_9GAMM|nr:efflux RND transporter periplasmic adaptor subunit [Sinobacterium caligoides]ROS05360.1 HlyD family secretion protein [Sinobacterium caligoides]